LLRTEISFIPNASFRKTSRRSEDQILREVCDRSADPVSAKLPRDLPAHLARLCAAPLLSSDEERDLFLKMNFLKFRANSIRSRLDADEPDETQVVRCERLLEAAAAVRDRIICANMRLAISVVRKYVTPRQSFDQLLSEGAVSLMQAVEKFDFDRGFRFSTYAYRAIARNAYRSLHDQHRHASRFVTGSDEIMDDAVEENRTSAATEMAWDALRGNLSDMLSRLDRREQFIIRSRYALGAHRKVRTFQCLADKLGVSKERVRQLEQRAVEKLRTMAAEGLDAELCEAALA
jgi:RNA polymerase primary sigma factor